MTLKQKKFVDEYIKCGNATEAYKLAYSLKSNNVAAVNSFRLLRNPNLRKYIQERNKDFFDDNVADIREVKEFWTGLLRDTEARMSDRLKASEFIARTNGAFLDKIEIKESVPIKIINDIPKEKEEEDG